MFLIESYIEIDKDIYIYIKKLKINIKQLSGHRDVVLD